MDVHIEHVTRSFRFYRKLQHAWMYIYNTSHDRFAFIVRYNMHVYTYRTRHTIVWLLSQVTACMYVHIEHVTRSFRCCHKLQHACMYI